MKRMIYTLVLALVVESVAPSFVQATVYVSNVGPFTSGSKAVGIDSWIAASLETGPDSAGYTLNSVQLLMDPASGSPGGFTVSIYDFNNSSSEPGSSVGTLTGPDPAGGGIFDYIATNITLSPSTSYFVVATSTTPIASGAYVWSLSGAGSVSGGWLLGSYASSSDGSSWVGIRSPALQFAVDATVIPEPSTYALAAMGLAVLGYGWRRRAAYQSGRGG